MTQKPEKLLNLFNIFCLGLGGAIGSGIFVLLGIGIGYTGRSIVLVVAVGCVFMLLAYMYNIVMSSMFVFKGGDYSQKAMLFGPVLTGVSGIFTLLNGFALSMYAIGMVEYASQIFPVITPYTKLIAIAIMTLFFASTIKGSKFVAMLNNIMTIVLIISIAVFAFAGVPQIKSGYFNADGFFTNGVGGFFAAISIMGWACQGTTMAPVSMASVTHDPKKTIPKAIFLITIALAVVYSLMSVVAAGVLPLSEVSNKNLGIVAKEIFPNWIYVIFILGGAVFALATSLLGAIAMLRYPVVQVAEDGWLPPAFKKKTANGFPWVVQLMFYIFSIVPIILGFSLGSIVSLIMIPSMLFNAYLNLSCIKLVKDYPKQWKNSILHMPMPLFTVVMILSCCCDLIVVYNLFISMKGTEMLMMIGMMLFCVIFALIRLKTGAVNTEYLQSQKDAIIKEANESIA